MSTKPQAARTARTGPRRRRVTALACAIAVAAGITTLGTPVVPAPSASAAACTDNGTTRQNMVLNGMYIELRSSPNCFGTFWFRMNESGIRNQSWIVTLQLRNRSGTVVNGSSQSTWHAPSSWVSTAYTNYAAARLSYRFNGSCGTVACPTQYTAWVASPYTGPIATGGETYAITNVDD